jgi:hypothetical protein
MAVPPCRVGLRVCLKASVFAGPEAEAEGLFFSSQGPISPLHVKIHLLHCPINGSHYIGSNNALVKQTARPSTGASLAEGIKGSFKNITRW